MNNIRNAIKDFENFMKFIEAEKTIIESLELYKGERFLYLFDFGDEWEFKVELLEHDDEAPVILRPMIIESKGKSPEQYGGGW